MFMRNICATLVAASLIALPIERAQADEGAALLGGMLLGGIIVNEVNKNRQRQRVRTTTTTTKTRRKQSGISTAQRQQNRQVQSALNYFGYNVGTVDGSIGRKTRGGIARYQSDMGYQPDGRLDGHERDFLLNSHQRATATSHVAPYNQILASQGQRGLLRTYRNEQLGIPTPSVQTAAVQAPAPTPAPAPAPVPATAPAPAPQTESVPARANNASLPEFTFGQTSRSVNEHCNDINVLTAANGGMTTAGRVTDAEFALNEQFCLARTHAMADSTSIVATIPNMADDQIQQQCEGLSQVIAPHIEELAVTAPSSVLSETAGVLQASGQPIPQLVSGGKVCLGVGYRIGNDSMALASAVLLAAAKQPGYGEIVSHHLREGFGTSKAAPAQSAAWMSVALDGLAAGAPSVLGQSPDRVAVLRQAIGGGAATAALPAFPSNN